MSDEPEKIQNGSPDLAAENLAALEGCFPGVVADGVLDAARLGELTGSRVAGLEDGAERYGLMWAGKSEAVKSLLTPSRGALVPDLDRSVGFDTAENIFIEGDNLEVLKLLQKAYNDQIKLIYIDPPYNTGNDFVYDDDFSDGLRGYLEFTGQVDEEGSRTSARADIAGRKHSRWLSMMYPRLALARNLLAQDGAIFVSIDDNEAPRLRLALDEVFGSENFLAQMVWAAGRKNDSKFVSESHEYILVYGRNLDALNESIGRWRTRKEGLDEIYAAAEKLKRAHGDDYEAISSGLKEWFRSRPDGDPSKRHKHYSFVDARGVYFPDNISWPGGGGPEYDVLHPVTHRPVAIPSRGWVFGSPERMQEAIDEDRVHFGPDETSVPCIKAYLKDRELEVPYSVFYVDGRGATKRLRSLLGANVFENPKDETVLRRIVEFASQPGDLVMDFFAGSGSLAHAVALQNARDAGGRRCISVNLPEPVGAGRGAGDKFETVSAITYARLRAIMEQLDGAAARGLRAYKLGASHFEAPGESADAETLSLTEATLRADELDPHGVAAEVLLSEGVRLDRPWEWLEAGGASVARCDEVAVVLSLDLSEEVVEAALALEPRVLVFLEDGFANNDCPKANAFYACQQAGITMKTV